MAYHRRFNSNSLRFSCVPGNPAIAILHPMNGYGEIGWANRARPRGCLNLLNGCLRKVPTILPKSLTRLGSWAFPILASVSGNSTDIRRLFTQKNANSDRIDFLVYLKLMCGLAKILTAELLIAELFELINEYKNFDWITVL